MPDKGWTGLGSTRPVQGSKGNYMNSIKTSRGSTAEERTAQPSNSVTCLYDTSVDTKRRQEGPRTSEGNL